jgi:Tol biopolymer transport system component
MFYNVKHFFMILAILILSREKKTMKVSGGIIFQCACALMTGVRNSAPFRITTNNLINALIALILLVIALEGCTPNSSSPKSTGTPTAYASTTPKLTQAIPTPITSTPTVAPSPTFFPLPTGRIYFSENGRYLKMVDLATKKITQIVDQGFFGAPVIASTGKIYFLSKKDMLDPYELYRCDLDGGNLQLVALSPDGIGEIAVSPDGSRLAFLTLRDRSMDLSVLDYNRGGVETTIYTTADLFTGFSWSNDGKRIAFVIYKDNNGLGEEGDVYIADANGLNRIKINAPAPLSADAPAWSPDDSQIAVSMYDDKGLNLYLMNDRTQAMKKLTDYGVPVSKPVWSPTGDKIMFWRGTWIGTVSPDGTGLHVLVDTETSYNYGAAWSPDGRYIVYERRPNTSNMPTPTLYIVRVDGGIPILLTNDFNEGDGIDDLTWINNNP